MPTVDHYATLGMPLTATAAELRAAYRVIDLALPLMEAGKSLRFALMPEGKDPDDLIRAAGNLQSHGTSNVANVSQRAALAAVSGDLTDVADMRASFDRRRRRMVEMLRAIEGVDLLTPQGAFYAFPDLTAFLGRKVAGRVASTTSELATIILEEANVAIVPGEAFGAPGYARLSFALGDDDLGEGLTRIGELLTG